jgi:hypothetical protein
MDDLVRKTRPEGIRDVACSFKNAFGGMKVVFVGRAICGSKVCCFVVLVGKEMIE